MTLNSEQTVITCLVLHILADFPLQTLGTPSLAALKQRQWWSDTLDRMHGKIGYGATASERATRCDAEYKYGNDYKAALWCHSTVWAALTFLPLCAVPGWSAIVAANAVVHYLVDDLKANRLAINLRMDQTLHIVQIGLTLGVYFFVKFLIGG